MAHRNSSSSHALLIAFTVMLAAVSAQGCAAEDTDEVGATTQALLNQGIFLYYTDTRAATSFRVQMSALDDASGFFFAGDAYVPGGMVPSGGWENLSWTQNGLTQAGQQPPFNSSAINITDRSDTSYQFRNTRITVTATINGSCHTDSENIQFYAPNHLEFSGWGATWNGTCWVGNNLLSTHAGN